MTPYPKTFPSDAVGILASTITSPTPETAKAAWNVAGYALGVTLGETESLLPIAMPSSGLMMSMQPPTDAEAIEALTTLSASEADPKLMSGKPFPFTAQQILQWAMSILVKVAIESVK